MSMTDPIADLLTRIRNAQLAKHATVRVPASKIKLRIAEILVAEGYVNGVTEHEGDGVHRWLELELKYVEGREGAIQKMQRLSRPGRRRYVKTDEIPKVLNGLGIAIVSTSQGMMTDRDARERGVGGELICSVY